MPGRTSCGQVVEDMLFSKMAKKISVAVEEGYDPDLLREALGRALTERERHIITLHFGLGLEGEPVPLEAIAEKVFLTRERVRQILNQALNKLKLYFRQHGEDERAADVRSRPFAASVPPFRR